MGSLLYILISVSMLQILILSLTLLHPALGLRGLLRQRPPPEYETTRELPKQKMFDQILDHFTPMDNRTWNQRYWENQEHYTDGGPAFLMIGGEGAANPGWLNYGQWSKWAQQHGAAMFLLEHRYYGESHPVEDMRTENMVFLSSRQGLEDLGNFITAMNTEHHLTGPWITFGGSYPGSLSAWMRLRFPHLVSGAVSSSGPLLAKLDFFEYFQVVKDALDTYGSPGCNPALTEALTTVEEMVMDEDNWGLLSSMFQTCSPLYGDNQLDVKSFIEMLIDNLAGLVQYNGNQNMNISSLCSIMTDETSASPLERLAVVNSMMLEEAGEPCIMHDYDSFLNIISDIYWSGHGVGYRQWIWQTCTEFGWYQTTNQPSGVYGSSLDLGFFERWCQDAFGDYFTHERMEKNVEASNIEYGGITPDVHNVVFVQGTVDPWHAMGVLDDLREDAVSIVITGTSHCADMYGDKEKDSQDLVMARKRIGELVAHCVQQQQEK